ncbi:ATP-binding protein [Chloroflexus sp. MS-G]|uniref:ATP-binding protein n=1 Tax=Chloroflexus sp. MS-G TaxID=1521187 RepID=UPI001F485FD6|nr:ATP-binding protein [Chloroflexus sp. MS-G]
MFGDQRNGRINMTQTDPPVYQAVYKADLFVNREKEIETVTKALENIARGDAEQVRTIVFQGERGLGKSWLALHLHRSVLKQTSSDPPPAYRILSLLICLTPPPKDKEFQVGEREWYITSNDISQIESGDERHYEHLLQELLAWIAEQLDIVRTPYASLRDLSAWLAQDVRKKLESERDLIICLILDSVFEANRGFLDYLERYLLAAFAALPRVLIIMTGRGRPYLWKSPYLRLEREDQSLTPFSLEQVAEQIRKSLQKSSQGSPQESPQDTLIAANLSDEEFRQLAEKLAKKVINLGGGYPLTNELLARAFVDQVRDRLSKGDDLEQTINDVTIDDKVLEGVASRLLEVIPEKWRDELREVLNALCVLKDGFREHEMPYFLAELRNTELKGPEYTIAAMRGLRDLLLETNLGRWQDARYVLDEAVRTVLEQLLKSQKREVWRRLHERAVNLYEDWAKRYPNSRQYFEQRAEYHRGVLAEDVGHSVSFA